jgi:hypothetical protein
VSDGLAPTPRLGRAAPLLIAVAFFVAGFLVREHYGTTWDEAESYHAGQQNLDNAARLLRGDSAAIEWPWHELIGYQLVVDTTRSAFARVVERLLPPSPTPVGEHLFNLALTSTAVALTGALALELGGSALLGALAAVALALQPKLVAHAQSNPKDLPGLFVITLAMYAIVRMERRQTPATAVGAAFAIGLAFTTTLLSIVLAPLAVWRSGRRHLARTASVLGGALAIAFVLWPWLWRDPVARLTTVVQRLSDFPAKFPVLYFGGLYQTDALPRHYTLGSLLVATPLSLVALGVLGAARVADRSEQARGRRVLAAVALGWLAGVLGLNGLAGFQYDGMRHVLSVLPAIAVLAALGAERLYAALHHAISRRASARVASAVAALALAAPATAIAVDLVRLHPYQDAYLARPFRWLAPGANERMFELEYWGGSYREVALWLEREAEPGAAVVAPLASHCLEPYLRSDLVVRGQMRRRLAAQARPYLVFMTREAWYTPGMRQIVDSERPLYAVTTPFGTLAVVYRPQRLPHELTRAGEPSRRPRHRIPQP